MAIAIDQTSSEPGGTQRTTVTWSHTVTIGGSQRFLLVGAFAHAAPMGAPMTATFNGVSMSTVGTYQVHSTGYHAVQLFSLVNPDTEAHDIVITGGDGAYLSVAGCALSFTGVDQSTPLGTPNAAVVTSETLETTVTSAVDEWVVDIAGTGWATGSIAADASQTQRFEFCYGYTEDGNQARRRAGMSTKPGAASVTMLWTGQSGDGSAILAVPVKPAAASSTTWLRHRA